MQFSDPIPFLEAIRIAQDRQLLPTNLSAAQIAEWDNELKRLSVFSARTNHAGYLQGVKDTTESLLQGEFNEATARAKLQDLLDSLGYNPQRGGFPGLEDPNIPPAEPGSLRDLSSDKRTQLVLRTQMRQMANRGYREQGTTRQALFTFPCWELIRIYPRTVPRGSAGSKSAGWPERWNEAGGTFYGPAERMIAPKDDPVWAALGSRDLFADAIGTDYPPFAFNSGMGWRQVSRDVCQSLGVPFKDKPKPPPPAPPLDDARISVKGLDPEFLKQLKEDLDLEIMEGVARLKEQAQRAAEIAAATSLGTPVSGAANILTQTAADAARYRAALAVIDQVHGDGPLVRIPFTNEMPPGDYVAAYMARPTAAGRIAVLPGLPDTEFALTHEIGHWLDHIGIPSATKFASESAPELQAWKQALDGTQAYQSLLTDSSISAERRAYLLLPEELWARSYAQFIAEESGDPTLQASLEKVVSGKFPGLSANTHWETVDFAPVRAAIRDLFVKLGWMRPIPGG